MSKFSRSRFLLNSAVITRPGTYKYRLVSIDEAREWLQTPYVSRLRHSVTADAIEILLGTRPPLKELYAVWPCLVPREHIIQSVDLLEV